jgi:micrococcal nuclease
LTLIFLTLFPHAHASISLELNSNDQLATKTNLINHDDEISQEFVYLVQVEDDRGYAVSLTFQSGTLLPGGQQDVTIDWSSEDEGTYAIKSFVWSDFDHPIPLMHLTHKLIIAVNGEETVVCAGSASCFTGKVSKVVDGDTLEVGDIRIRLALVNTPEIDEEGYEKAKDFTSTLCPVGSRVLVDQDDGQLQDDFGRMLAKITCGDTKNLNSELLKNGHAGILTQYCVESEFSIEDWARENGCVINVRDQITVNDTPIITPAAPLEEMNCDPSYPNVCIPPSPPDLDCDEITYRDFKVLQPDPHGFDGDNDGIGCES